MRPRHASVTRPTQVLRIRPHSRMVRADKRKGRAPSIEPSRPAISARSQLRPGTPTALGRGALPLLPSGPGGVRQFPSRGAQPSTPPHPAHSTRAPLKGEFNPAIADCGLQGTATSPSSTAKSKNGGGGGIRTHGTVARTRHFQCRTFGHSATPPHDSGHHDATLVRRKWRRGEDLNPRGTYAPIRFRVGRLQPGSATPPRAFA